MLYTVTFTINIPQILAYIPYMDPIGYIYICTNQTCGCFVKWVYPQSSILIGVSIVNHPAIGAPPFMENAIHETMLKDSFVLYPFHPMSIFSHREGCFALQSFGSNFSSRRLADGSLQGSWMVQFMQHTSYNWRENKGCLKIKLWEL